MAPKRHGRGAAGASVTRGVAGCDRRGRGARAPRAARCRRGHGGSSWAPSAAAVDEGVCAHDFVLHSCGCMSSRIVLPSSFDVLVSELNLDGL